MDCESLFITITMFNSDVIHQQYANCALLILCGNNLEQQQETRDIIFKYCTCNNLIAKEWEFDEVNKEDNTIVVLKCLKMADNNTMKFIIMEKDECNEN